MDTSTHFIFNNVSIGYGRKNVLTGINLRIPLKSRTGLIGQNGSGKTTFIKTLLGLHKNVQGELSIPAGLRFGYAPQRGTFDLLVPLSVFEFVTTDAMNDTDSSFLSYWSGKLDISDLLRSPFAALSGGQKQRAIILRALMQKPNCLILDEPTDNLDICGTRQLLAIIDEYSVQYAASVFIVSHYLNNVINNVDQLLIFKDKAVRSITINNDTQLQAELRTAFDTALTVKTMQNIRIAF